MGIATWEELRDKARECNSPEDLAKFVEATMSAEHDYGSVVDAVAACMVAAMTVADRMPHGGITGFQASGIGWRMVRHCFCMSDGPLSLRWYDDMLYPQYASKFAQTISAETWQWLREEADRLLTERCNDASDRVYAHWKSIHDGVVPFGYTVEVDSGKGCAQ